jgi:hypothetical protein
VMPTARNCAVSQQETALLPPRRRRRRLACRVGGALAAGAGETAQRETAVARSVSQHVYWRSSG